MLPPTTIPDTVNTPSTACTALSLTHSMCVSHHRATAQSPKMNFCCPDTATGAGSGQPHTDPRQRPRVDHPAAAGHVLHGRPANHAPRRPHGQIVRSTGVRQRRADLRLVAEEMALVQPWLFFQLRLRCSSSFGCWQWRHLCFLFRRIPICQLQASCLQPKIAFEP